MILRPQWSRPTDARLSGLSLAREAGLVFAWDEAQSLYLWDLDGRRRARQAFIQPIAAAGMSDDGSHVVVAGKHGLIWWLNAQLELRFDQALPIHPLALAVESLGRYVAVSDHERHTYLLARSGRLAATVDTPRPLRFLSFVATQPWFLGAADYGYVACFDMNGRCLWRDAPVSYIGSLSADGDGQNVVLACFSNGLLRHHAPGGHGEFLPTFEPCRLATMDFDASLMFLAGEAGSLSLLNRGGEVIASLSIERPAVALALGALGEVGVYGLADGHVALVDIVHGR